MNRRVDVHYRLPADLFAAARAKAGAERTTVTALVEQGLRHQVGSMLEETRRFLRPESVQELLDRLARNE